MALIAATPSTREPAKEAILLSKDSSKTGFLSGVSVHLEQTVSGSGRSLSACFACLSFAERASERGIMYCAACPDDLLHYQSTNWPKAIDLMMMMMIPVDYQLHVAHAHSIRPSCDKPRTS